MTIDRARTQRVPSPKVDVELDGTLATARLVGDVDPWFTQVAIASIENAVDHADVSRLVVDLDRTLTFGAAGIALLVRANALCEEQRVQFEVANPSRTASKVLEMCGFDRFLASGVEPDPTGSRGLIASDRFERVIATAMLNGRDALVLTTDQLADPGPAIVFVNRAFTDLYGYSADEMIGQTPRMLQGPLTDRSTLDRMKDHLRRGVPFESDLINYRNDGTPFVMSWKVMPVAASDSDEGGVYMSLQSDVTAERRQRRFDMANAVLDAQFLNRAFDDTDRTIVVEQAMTTLLLAQTMMLGTGVATLVLTDRNDCDHRYSTAATDVEVRDVDEILGSYGRDPIDGADLVVDGPPHLRIDVATGSSASYRCARFVLSGVHRDWIRLAGVDYHERLIRRVFGHIN